MNDTVRRRLSTYWLETKYELLKQFRIPATVIFSLGFPIVFYTVFGEIYGRAASPGGVPYSAYYIALYGAFGIIGAAFYSLGAGIAVERGQGWMLLKRASPMPLDGYVIARVLASLISGLLIVATLSVCGIVLLGLRLPFSTWLRLFATLIAGATPFCAFGLAIGCWAGPNSAAGVVNLINLPTAFLSGLWVPLEILPDIFRRIARFLPQYHYGQLALQSIGSGFGSRARGHILVLAGFTVLSVALAYIGYRRDDDRTYG